MAASHSREISVGVVTVLALVLLIGGIIWAKGFGLGVDSRTVELTFPSAAGVEIGTPITVRGVRVGSVTSFDVRPDDVRIVATINNSLRLQKDAIAELQMLEVTGGKKIELTTGDSREPLPSGTVVPGKVQGDITAVLADVGDISAQAKQLIGRVDSSVMMLNQVLGNPALRVNLERTMSNLEEGSTSARNLITANRAAIDRTISNFSETSSQLRSLVARVGPSVEQALGSAEELSIDARRTIVQIDNTLRHADSLLVHVDSITVDIRSGKGAVSKLLYDEKFASEIDSTLQMLQDLIEDIQKNGVRGKIKIGL